LDRELTSDELRGLISDYFLTDEAQATRGPDNDWLLAPPVEGLVHGGLPDDLTQCRDIRYRFDNDSATPEQTEASELLLGLFDPLGARWADLLEEEAREALVRAGRMVTRIRPPTVDALLMAARTPDATALIRRIWLGPEADEVLNP
jgi:hypothetical protein